MPHFTLQLSPQGPLLNAVISISKERTAALTAANQPIPNPVSIRALVDTGASTTCIDPSILQALSLTPTGNIKMVTPSTGKTPVDIDQYDVSIMIPAALNQIPFHLHTIPVACTDLVSSQGFHALIGRDILSHCLLTYNGSMAVFTLAF